MEFSNIVLGLILLAIIAVPMWLAARTGKKRKEGLSAKFSQLMEQYQLNASEMEQWDNVAVGIDEGAKKLLWVRKTALGTEEHHLIDFSTIGQCKKVKLDRTVQMGKENTQILEQLRLDLFPKDNQVAPVLLEFYHSSQIFQLNVQLELLDKWHKRISAVLKP
jgi:hypothetical protein